MHKVFYINFESFSKKSASFIYVITVAGKYWPISINLSQVKSVMNCRIWWYKIFHLPLNLLQNLNVQIYTFITVTQFKSGAKCIYSKYLQEIVSFFYSYVYAD